MRKPISTPKGCVCFVIRSTQDQILFLSKHSSDSRLGAVWEDLDLVVFVPEQHFGLLNAYWSGRIRWVIRV
jgi:hypothetical protein